MGKNKRKQSCLHGEQYVNTAGNIVMAKSKCRPCVCQHGRQIKFRCHEFSEESRQQLNSEYYGSEDYCRQRDFIICHTTVVSSVSNKRNKRFLNFSLPHGGVKVQVCKRVFMATLVVSEKLITYTIDKMINEGVQLSVSDKRGKHEPHNKTSVHMLESVRSHICSFSAVDSHYTRSKTARKFLSADLNITKMYELYAGTYKNDGKEFVEEGVYRRVFCEDFNLSFHHPKKDTCTKCEQYENADEDEKTSLEENYKRHITRKDQARK